MSGLNVSDVESSEHDSSHSESEADEEVFVRHKPVSSRFHLEVDGTDELGPVQSSFDRYFALANKRFPTSANVFSRTIPPVDREQFANTLKYIQDSEQVQQPHEAIHSSFQALLPAHLLELTMGFNLMFYGFGSKRAPINELAKFAARSGHVFIASGFLPEFTLKDFFMNIDDALNITSPPLDNPQPESHCQRLCELQNKNGAHRLYIVFHNLDVIGIRNPRAKKCIQILNSCTKIHIISSVDNIMAPLMWANVAPAMDTKPSSSGAQVHSTRGLSWLWHDLTTTEPYDVELAHIDRTNFASAHVFKKSSKQQVGSAAQGAVITETAAHHVLASVTDKAKKLFLLVGRSQIEASTITDSSSTQNQPQDAALSYDLLFASARDDFIATNDTALRALLSEFRDHGMIMSASSAEGGEVLWIPIPKENLGRILRTLET